MQRRVVLRAGLAMAASPGLFRAAEASAAQETGAATPFDAGTVKALAKALAAKPFRAPDTGLPDALRSLNYDQYRSIRFDPGHALWRGDKLPFEVQFFHRGFLYTQRVDIFEVSGGQARPVPFNPDLFTYGLIKRPDPADLGFAGFRVHAAFNRPDYADEVCAFLGASYFRAVAKGQGYGLSARGLAINTGDPKGEEFPTFRAFWLERPQPGTAVLVVHALLDSESCSGAYRFTIRPGDQTIFDVECALYPRADIATVGFAPLTSMFDFDASERAGVDDWRPAVHDSDALAMWTGRGERLFRALANPRDLQISVFGDTSPRGFGLIQRKRDFRDYDDLESHYEKRPSAWVEPIGDAGAGGIMLVEIPSKGEVHDNIVAFWRPHDALKAKGEYGLTYRLHWAADVPFDTDLARVVDTRVGAVKDGVRAFVIEVAGGRLKGVPPGAKLHIDASAAAPAKLQNLVAQDNPETGGWRMSLELDTQGARSVEMRAALADEHGPVSETWLYRWTS